MAASGHKPHWPDKAMFASIMLILAGTMGTLFAAVENLVSFHDCPATTVPDASACHPIPGFLRGDTQLLQLVLSLATMTLGFVSLRARRKRFSYVGCITGIASLGFVGLEPVLSLIAAGFVIQAHREGEDMAGTKRVLKASDWPDKALACSLFLLVAGVLVLLQGSLIAFGAFAPIVLSAAPAAEGVLDVLAGLWCVFASWQIYHLRRPWAGFLAVGLAALTLGLYIIGPLLGATALVLLLMANRENEFAVPA